VTKNMAPSTKNIHNILIFLKNIPALAQYLLSLCVCVPFSCLINNSEKFSQNNIKNPDFDSVNQVPGFFMVFAGVLGKNARSSE